MARLSKKDRKKLLNLLQTIEKTTNALAGSRVWVSPTIKADVIERVRDTLSDVETELADFILRKS